MTRMTAGADVAPTAVLRDPKDANHTLSLTPLDVAPDGKVGRYLISWKCPGNDDVDQVVPWDGKALTYERQLEFLHDIEAIIADVASRRDV